MPFVKAAASGTGSSGRKSFEIARPVGWWYPRNVKRTKGQRTTMEVGDRVLIRGDLRRQVMIVARVDIPHSTQKVFLSRSGGDFTVGLKVWRSDYAWSEKNQMWVSKR